MMLIHQRWHLKLLAQWDLEGAKKADPALLEPVKKVEVVTPEDYMGDVVGT